MQTKINPSTMKDTMEEGYNLFCRKNQDYGNSFERSIDKRGVVAALVRMDDKMHRVDELLASTRQSVTDESLIDTLVDLANYTFMLATYLKERDKNATEPCAIADPGTSRSDYPARTRHSAS